LLGAVVVLSYSAVHEDLVGRFAGVRGQVKHLLIVKANTLVRHRIQIGIQSGTTLSSSVSLTLALGLGLGRCNLYTLAFLVEAISLSALSAGHIITAEALATLPIARLTYCCRINNIGPGAS